MTPTDTSERGLESLIVAEMLAHGWLPGQPQDYDREYAVDLEHLLRFLLDTQPDSFTVLQIEEDGPPRRQFLARIQGEISKRGVIDVLRRGIKHHSASLDLFYGTPSRRMRRQLSVSPRIGSASPANCVTAATNPNSHSIYAYSLTAFRSPRSNSRTTSRNKRLQTRFNSTCGIVTPVSGC